MSRSYKKQPYQKSRKFDKSCRCSGSCPYCINNRTYTNKRNEEIAKEEIKNYYKDLE